MAEWPCFLEQQVPDNVHADYGCAGEGIFRRWAQWGLMHDALLQLLP